MAWKDRKGFLGNVRSLVADDSPAVFVAAVTDDAKVATAMREKLDGAKFVNALRRAIATLIAYAFGLVTMAREPRSPLIHDVLEVVVAALGTEGRAKAVIVGTLIESEIDDVKQDGPTPIVFLYGRDGERGKNMAELYEHLVGRLGEEFIEKQGGDDGEG